MCGRVSITVSSTDAWPEAISDGLTLPCSICGVIPYIDYRVGSDLWGRVVPEAYRRGVVCLSCLDRLASDAGLDVAAHLEFAQFTGVGKTIVLLPDRTYYYAQEFVR